MNEDEKTALTPGPVDAAVTTTFSTVTGSAFLDDESVKKTKSEVLKGRFNPANFVPLLVYANEIPSCELSAVFPSPIVIKVSFTFNV